MMALESLRKLLPLALLAALFIGWYMLIEAWKSDAYSEGFKSAKDAGDLALEKLRGEHQVLELTRAEAVIANAKATAKRLRDEQARNDKLASELAELKRQYRKNTDRLTQEIARVNDLYREALDAPPMPLPACVFTAGWVRIYDEATGARAAQLPAATDTGGTAAQAASTAAAEQLATGVSQRSLLEHHVKYAEQCRATAAQLGLLIDAVKGQ